MHDQTIHSAPPPDVRHEPTDIDTRPLRIAAIIFVVSMMAILLALFGLFRHYEGTAVAPERNLVNEHVREARPPRPSREFRACRRFMETCRGRTWNSFAANRSSG